MLIDCAYRLFLHTSENYFKVLSQKLQRQSKNIDLQITLSHISGFLKRSLKKWYMRTVFRFMRQPQPSTCLWKLSPSLLVGHEKYCVFELFISDLKHLCHNGRFVKNYMNHLCTNLLAILRFQMHHKALECKCLK